MHAIRVQYTVREDFVETNASNIRDVMEELRALGDVGLQYSAFRVGDGRTFVHLVLMQDKSKGSIIPNLAAFSKFQAALKGGVESPPANEAWTVVGSSVVF